MIVSKKNTEPLYFIKKFWMVAIILIGFGAIALVSPAYAAETLTLDQVITRVQKDNIDELILNTELSYAAWQQVQAYQKVSDLEAQLEVASDEQKLSLAKQAYLEPLRASYKVERLIRDQERLQTKLKNDAEAAYLALVDSKAALLQVKYSALIAQKDETAKKLLLERGRIARIDYDRAILKRTEADQQVVTLERNIELMYLKLNALMERPATDRYEVTTPQLELSLPIISDISAAVENYKKFSEKLLTQNETILLAEKELDLVGSYGVSTSGAEADRNVFIEKLRLELAVRSADYDFRIAWNDLQSSYDNFVLEYGKYNLSAKEYEITKIRYERGMITPTVYLQAASTHEAARLSRQKALQSFHLARGDFMMNYSVVE